MLYFIFYLYLPYLTILYFIYIRNTISHCYYYPVANIRFEQSTYNVDENDGPVQAVLVLSNPLSSNVTVEVMGTDISATGDHETYNNLYSIIDI